MNSLQYKVISVVDTPHERGDGVWTATILVSDGTGHYEKVVADNKRWDVEKYEVGYTWWQ